MTYIKTSLSLVTLAALSMLTGCASTMKAEENTKKSVEKSDKIIEDARIKTTTAFLDKSREAQSNISRINKDWVDPNPLPKNTRAYGKNLPKTFLEPVSLNFPGKVSIPEVVSELQRSTGVKVIINQDVYNSSTGNGSLVTTGTGTAATPTPSTGMPSSQVGTNNAIPVFVTDMVFRGSLENALDFVSAKANISWKYVDGKVEIFRFENKSYVISALAGKTNTSTTVSMGGGTSGRSGGSSSAGSSTSTTTSGVTRTSELATWEEVKTYILGLTSPQGKVSILESAGIVNVKDTPMNQNNIAKAVKDLNEVLGKQIFVDVDVYAVTVNDEDNYGFNWSLAWSRASQNYGLTLGSTNTMNVSSPASFGVNIVNGAFTGTTATLNALSSIGKTSQLHHYTVSTLNGQTTPIGNNKKIDYIQNVTVTQPTVAGGTPTQSRTPGSVYQGITMNVTPRLQIGSDKILLEYAMTLSSLDAMNKDTDSSGNAIGLPQTSIKNILQRSSLKSGQTLVLSGFKSSSATINNSGVGSPSNQLLGGARDSQNTSQYLVITVTPYVAQESE